MSSQINTDTSTPATVPTVVPTAVPIATSAVVPIVVSNATPIVTTTVVPTITQPNIIRLRPQPLAVPLPSIEGGGEFVANTNIAVPGELISGFLHRRTKCVLGGSSKAGKTWIELDIGISVVSGTPFLGMNTVAGPVLFINLEIQKEFFQRRVRAVQQSKGVNNLDNLHIWNLRGELVTFDRLLSDLRRQQNRQYSLIIIDPIYKLMTGKSESSGSNISTLAHNIDRLIAETGSAVVYTNHYSKGNQSKKRSVDRLGGSGVYARDADTIITLTDHRQPRCFTVEITERNLPPVERFVVEWHYPVMVLRPSLNPTLLATGEDNGPTEMEINFVRGLLEHVGLTTDAWQAAAISGGLSVANFTRIHQRLEAMEQVRRDGEGVWRPNRPEQPAAPVNVPETQITPAYPERIAPTIGEL